MDFEPGFAASLRLRARPVVVVGAGHVALRKTRALVAARAHVSLIAPAACRELQELAVGQGGPRPTLGIRWHRRGFKPTDLDGAVLAFAATNVSQVNAAVAVEARARGVLVNVADDPEASDFFLPAAVQQGPLQIAVCTGGTCPAAAAYLARWLAAWAAHGPRAYCELMAHARLALRQRGEERAERVRALATGGLLEALCRGDRAQARAMLSAQLPKGTILP